MINRVAKLSALLCSFWLVPILHSNSTAIDGYTHETHSAADFLLVALVAAKYAPMHSRHRLSSASAADGSNLKMMPWRSRLK